MQTKTVNSDVSIGRVSSHTTKENDLSSTNTSITRLDLNWVNDGTG